MFTHTPNAYVNIGRNRSKYMTKNFMSLHKFTKYAKLVRRAG